MDTRTSPARLHIERIRDVLRREGCAAALVPSSDPHLSEYLPERWQGRQWASGFTGSVGTLAVTLTRAALFADSRYWVQAERELAGSGIDLVKVATPAAAQHIEWLCREVEPGATVAVDGDDKVGMVFGELAGGEVNVRIWIHPEHRKKGYGTAALRKSRSEMAAHFPAVPLVVRAPGSGG